MAKTDLFATNATKRKKDETDYKVTFGVFGLTEWETLIPAGLAKVRVRFTGGSLSGYGVTPATFVTRNMHIKELIVDSPQFKSGRIKLL